MKHDEEWLIENIPAYDIGREGAFDLATAYAEHMTANAETKIAELEQELSRFRVEPMTLGMHAMHGNHTFTRFDNVTSPDDLIRRWKAMGGGRTNDISLCPVIVKSHGKELRRVGNMLFDADDELKVSQFINTLKSDADVVRLMAKTKDVEVES